MKMHYLFGTIYMCAGAAAAAAVATGQGKRGLSAIWTALNCTARKWTELHWTDDNDDDCVSLWSSSISLATHQCHNATMFSLFDSRSLPLSLSVWICLNFLPRVNRATCSLFCFQFKLPNWLLLNGGFSIYYARFHWNCSRHSATTSNRKFCSLFCDGVPGIAKLNRW